MSKIRNFLLLCFSILQFTFKSSCSTTRVHCPGRWIPSGFGTIPANSVPCSKGTKEYIGRVFNSDSWIPARVIPSEGKAFAVSDSGQSLETETYEILTVPIYCSLNWVYASDGDAPQHAFSADNLAPEKAFIGRSTLMDQNVCGKVLKSTNGISMSYDDIVQTSKNYEVLTSVYPPLKMSITNIVLNRTVLIGKNTTELIGQEHIQIQGNYIVPKIEHRIQQSKVTQEHLIFLETNPNHEAWIGISEIDILLCLWYGTDDVIIKGMTVDEEEPELSYYRKRTVTVDAMFTGEGAAIPTDIRRVEICSVLNVYVIEDGDPIPFKATALFRADGVPGEEVLNIAEALGRTVTPSIRNKNTVTGDIEGVLWGKFVTDTLWYGGDPAKSPNLSCSGYLN